MKERLLEFLRAENKSSALFAEEIGVQPSGISHILSGRNNPSLDFVVKMLEKYQFISSDWLLFGKGPMYKEAKMHTLFDESEGETGITVESDTGGASDMLNNEGSSAGLKFSGFEHNAADTGNKSSISRIIIFFADKSFEEYTPRR